MTKVMTGATMSIDGYIAGPGESGFDLLFQWNQSGDVETRTGAGFTTRTSIHRMPAAPRLEAAVIRARQLAGDKNVGVNGGQMARQCLDAGLLDEVHIDLVPVLLGGGNPFFGGPGLDPVQLDGPISVVEGTGVTHIGYRVHHHHA